MNIQLSTVTDNETAPGHRKITESTEPPRTRGEEDKDLHLSVGTVMSSPEPDLGLENTSGVFICFNEPVVSLYSLILGKLSFHLSKKHLIYLSFPSPKRPLLHTNIIQR